MRITIAIAASAIAMLLCSGRSVLAQDAPAPGTRPPDKPTGSENISHPMRVRIGGNVQAAKMVHQVQPKYPKEAKQSHISGTVVLRAVIAKNGTIQELQFVSGAPELMRSAMDAVRQWRYKPTELEGRPVEVETTISVVYNLIG
jgi:periplasmic protein TonB